MGRPGWSRTADMSPTTASRRAQAGAFGLGRGALAAARVHRVPLVVAKVDRLTRSVAFLSRLLEAGADVRFADLPALEGPGI
jgi:hypothetical protein